MAHQTTDDLRLAMPEQLDKPEEELDDQDQRVRRAREEPMVVIPGVDANGYATGLYDVLSTSGKSYTVDMEAKHARCECPDYQYNVPEGGRCKHICRVAIEITECDLPGPGEPVPEGYIDDKRDALETQAAELIDVLQTTQDFLTRLREESS